MKLRRTSQMKTQVLEHKCSKKWVLTAVVKQHRIAQHEPKVTDLQSHTFPVVPIHTRVNPTQNQPPRMMYTSNLSTDAQKLSSLSLHISNSPPDPFMFFDPLPQCVLVPQFSSHSSQLEMVFALRNCRVSSPVPEVPHIRR